ncbi:hypothetical protein J1N35_036664 [Gossypium stocksii]|uniref:Uncharacterized protein n=1 Tax=Gossypium stocksii TaxID=47602 RepID=A0A9D3UID2_9ROSI|nr:hypothetical protein J1N35_036664 [Gossypium stocksii]
MTALVVYVDIILKIYCMLSETASQLKKFGCKSFWMELMGVSLHVTFFSGLSLICRVLLNQPLMREDVSRQEELRLVAQVPKNWISLEGLAVIQDRRYVEVMIQIGSLEAIRTIKDSSLTSLNFVLIRRIHHLLQNARLWVIQHSPKDFSKIVDCLANIAFDTNQDLKIFVEIPREVLALFFFYCCK